MAEPEELLGRKAKLTGLIAEAEAAWLNYDAIAAVPLFEKVIVEAKVDKSFRDYTARAELSLAWIDEASGRWNESRARFERALGIAGALDAAELAVAARIGLGVIALHQRMIPAALEKLEKALKEAVRAGLREAGYRAKIYLAHGYALDDRHKEAEEALVQTVGRLEHYLVNGYDTHEIRELLCLACNRRGIDLFRSKRLDEAEAAFRKGLAAAAPIERSVVKAETLRYLGVIHSAKKEFVESIEAYAKALAILKHCTHAPSLARLYASIGRTYMDTGDLALAQANFMKAKAICLKLDLKSNVAEICSMLGHIAMRREEYEEAQKLYSEDLAITRHLADKLALGYAHRNLGAATRRLGRHGVAANHLAEAERSFRDAKSIHNLALTLLQRAELALEKGSLEEAKNHAEESEELFHSLNKLDELGFVHKIFGAINEREGDLGPAEERYLKAIALFREHKIFFPLLETTHELGMLYAHKGRRDLAAKLLGDAFKLAEKYKLTRTLARISQRIEEIDEGKEMDLSVERMTETAIVEMKREKDEAVGRLAAAGAESVHVLVGFTGLDALGAALGRDRAQAVASKLAATVTFNLAGTPARLNFNAGFCLSFIAAPPEGRAPADLLVEVLAALEEAGRDLGTLLAGDFRDAAARVGVAALVDLAPLEFMAFTWGAVRENFPVSARARESLIHLLALDPAPGVSIYLYDAAAEGANAKAARFRFEPAAVAGVPLKRLRPSA